MDPRKRQGQIAPGTRRGVLWIGGVSFVLALVYLIGTNRCYPIVDDTLPFAIKVNREADVHVHHLVLNVLRWLNHALGISRDNLPGSILLFRCYVAFTSFLTLLLVGILTLRWFRSLRSALIALLLTAFAFGFWLYSMITDVPVPASAFGLLAVYLADRSFDFAERRRWLLIILASVAILLAALNHQSYSLIVLPISAILLFWDRRGSPWKNRVGRAALLIGLTGLLGFGAYDIAYRSSAQQKDFITFIRGFQASGKSFPSDRLQVRTPVYAGIGITRALFFPEYAVSYNRPYDIVCREFPFRFMSKYRYLIRDVPGAVVFLALVVSGLLLFAWGLAVMTTLRCLARHRPRAPGFWMVWSWIVLNGLFSAWWLASSREFWIWLVPFMSLAGTGIVLRSLHGRARVVLPVLIVVSMFAVNIPAIASLWNPGHCFYGVNKTYLSTIGSDDVAISPYGYSISQLSELQSISGVVYEINPIRFLISDPDLLAILRDVESRGGSVFLDPRWWMPEAAEMKRLNSSGKTRWDALETELRGLEAYCAARSIPLYGVVRKGSDIIPLRAMTFNGYLEPIDAPPAARSP